MIYKIGFCSVEFYDCDEKGVKTALLDLTYRVRKFPKRVCFSVSNIYHEATKEKLEHAKSMLPEVARKILGLNCVVKVK